MDLQDPSINSSLSGSPATSRGIIRDMAKTIENIMAVTRVLTRSRAREAGIELTPHGTEITARREEYIPEEEEEEEPAVPTYAMTANEGAHRARERRSYGVGNTPQQHDEDMQNLKAETQSLRQEMGNLTLMMTRLMESISIPQANMPARHEAKRATSSQEPETTHCREEGTNTRRANGASARDPMVMNDQRNAISHKDATTWDDQSFPMNHKEPLQIYNKERPEQRDELQNQAPMSESPIMEHIAKMVGNMLKERLDEQGNTHAYVKPYSFRIQLLEMPRGYQPPSFQHFNEERNPREHIARFVETCNNAGTSGDHMVK